MTVTTMTTNRLPTSEAEMRRQTVVATARLTAMASGAIGLVLATIWLLRPQSWEAIAVLALSVIVALSLGSMMLGQGERTTTAAALLVSGFMIVIAATGVALGGPLSLAVSQMVPVMLAGLLLERRSVLSTAAAAMVLFLLQLWGSGLGFGLVTLDTTEVKIIDVLAVSGIFLIVTQFASEFSERLRSALVQTESRAVEAERQAQELRMAKAEIEQRAAELAAAKQEIESRTQLSAVVAGEIRVMAKELATTSVEQANGSTEQAAAMGEIVAAMEELSRAASQIAANSAQVSRQVSSALAAAESGHQAVEETIAGLDRIRSEVRTVAEKNLTLGQKTQAIGEIIEVISEIADRTHLLALNAAIESAAAGEYGRRFSVVASQVKELATEAKSAAHQVRVAVAEIQRAASSTVLAAEKSEADVEVGASLGRGAGDAIAQIVETVEEVASAAREMLLATQQQQSASEQVVSTIRQIEQVTRQTAEGSRQVSNTVNQLISTAERLQ